MQSFSLLLIRFCLLFFLAVPAALMAQRTMPETIRTEQPGFYIGPSTMFKGNLQVEGAFNLQSLSRGGSWKTYNLPAAIVRYGITNWLEARIGTEFQHSRLDFLGSALTTTTVNPFYLGTKVMLVPEGRKFPETSLRAQVRIPGTGGQVYEIDVPEPDLLLTTRKPFGNGFAASVNLGIVWDGLNSFRTYQYALAVDKTFGEKWTAYAEAYGFKGVLGNPVDHRYDAGLLYLINPNLQLDASGGFGWFDLTDRTWFVGTGISWRYVPGRNR